MNNYLSKSSVFVKIATVGTLILLTLVVISIITLDNNYGVIGGTTLIILTTGTAMYFYANSLQTIIVDKEVI